MTNTGRFLPRVGAAARNAPQGTRPVTRPQCATAGLATSIGSARGAHIAAGWASRLSVLRSRTNAMLPMMPGTHSEIAW
jgi:hypothetical protein